MPMTYPTRRFPRIRSENAILVKKLGPEDHEGFAKTRTLSPGGCSFVNSQSMGEGSVIELLMHVHGQVIRAVGRVIYESAQEDGTFEIGVEFGSLGTEDRAILERLFGSEGTVLSHG
jgi:hypothetical protein